MQRGVPGGGRGRDSDVATSRRQSRAAHLPKRGQSHFAITQRKLSSTKQKILRRTVSVLHARRPARRSEALQTLRYARGIDKVGEKHLRCRSRTLLRSFRGRVRRGHQKRHGRNTEKYSRETRSSELYR